MVKRYVLRTVSADGVALWIGEDGPTIARRDAIEFERRGIEVWRLAAEAFYRLPFDAVEVSKAASL
jgi:hypothetical protein